MPKFAANLTMMFNEYEFLDRFTMARRAGFTAVEVLFPYRVDAAVLANVLKEQGLTMALLNAPMGDVDKGDRGTAAIPDRQAEFEAGMHKALLYARATGCKLIHVLSGSRKQGASESVLIGNLRRAAQWAAADGVQILLEPINSRDMPDYFLNKTEQARRIIDAVAESNVGLQFDVYHRQIEEGDLTRSIKQYADLIRHFQIANPPDRTEPDIGEINYQHLFQVIDDLGFAGYVGCEYKPRAGTLAGLGWGTRWGLQATPPSIA